MREKKTWLGNAKVANTGLRDGLVALGYRPKKPRGRSFENFQQLLQYEARDAMFIPTEVDTLEKLKIWCEANDQ